MFGLARALGMTVGDLLDRMDADELADWAAFYSLEADPPKPDVETQLRSVFGRPQR